jgi:hypothetical protein
MTVLGIEESRRDFQNGAHKAIMRSCDAADNSPRTRERKMKPRGRAVADRQQVFELTPGFRGVWASSPRRMHGSERWTKGIL